MSAQPDWLQQLQQLLAFGVDIDDPVGARLDFYDLDGHHQHHAVLARHARLDVDCVWIRLIAGTGPSFDLHECRRRGLPISNVTAAAGQVRFETADGHVTVAAATDPDDLEILRAWDEFVLLELPASDEHAIAQLVDDSW